MEKPHAELQLPGFRFHPTEEELLDFYLTKMILGKNTCVDIIGYLNIYLYDPWLLPGLSKIGEREWYFFVPRDRKYGSGGRPNRTTKNGFWKATGSDRKIFGLSEPKKQLGLKKTLVFYKGRAPRGSKTDWVMNEYRLPDSCPLPKDIVLCKIYRKATSMKVLEQRAAMEEETKTIEVQPNSPPEIISFDPPPPKLTPSCNDETHQDLLLFIEDERMKEEPHELMSFDDQNDYFSSASMSMSLSPSTPIMSCHMASVNDDDLEFMTEEKVKDASEVNNRSGNVSSLKLPTGNESLPSLQLPRMSMDWNQDSFGTPLWSPWLDNWLLVSPYANILI